MEMPAGGGVLELGNSGGNGVLMVWEIQSEWGVKNACHPLGVFFFSGITQVLSGKSERNNKYLEICRAIPSNYNYGSMKFL